jgi:hypothetical protein
MGLLFAAATTAAAFNNDKAFVVLDMQDPLLIERWFLKRAR